jgi:zinc D-Ala-D-Ala carboxypeptidase
MFLLNVLPDGSRERVLTMLTVALAVALLPAAFAVTAWRRAPRDSRELAGRWALAARFPAEDLSGLTPPTLAAFTAARTEALWRDHQPIGLTSGHRDPVEQHRLFTAQVTRTGSVQAARRWVLPPEESNHVKGIALDIRPTAGARWLEEHGGHHHLYRPYDNEWWHFEYRPDYRGRPPRRLPHPGATMPAGAPTLARLSA